MRALTLIVATVGLLLAGYCSSVPKAEISTDNYSNFSVQFVDGQHGWIIGPRLFRTTDAGRSWQIIKYPRAEDAIKADDGPGYRKNYVQFVDRYWGWRCSNVDLSAVEYTENAGLSWSAPIRVAEGFRRGGIVFINRNHGWVLGSKVFVTTNRGQTWREETSLAGLDLKHPYFLDGDHGWIANESGVIARTNDGGQSWKTVTTSMRDVHGIFFATTSKGWLVGDDGLIATTVNGGSDWEKSAAPVPYDSRRNMRTTLLDVFFSTPDIGWIAGYDGTVLATRDGGKTWAKASTPTRAPLSSIRFVDGLHGWAVGGNAEPPMLEGQPSNVVIETDDGGRNWRAKTFQ
jgi:photosystem II stability/assembly factor-like uncharacterized protein